MAIEKNIKNDIESALRHLQDKINIIKEKVEKLCEQTTGCTETVYDIDDDDHLNSIKKDQKTSH